MSFMFPTDEGVNIEGTQIYRNGNGYYLCELSPNTGRFWTVQASDYQQAYDKFLDWCKELVKVKWADEVSRK